MNDEIIIHNQTLPVNEEVNPSGVSHGFDTGYAIAYGVDEAIMIRNLQFFISANANRGHNLHEGRFWTYDRLDDFLNHFPYWSVQSVRRILQSLINQQVLIKGDFNKSWSNRTAWYAFKDQEKFITNVRPPKTPSPLPPAEMPKPTNGEFKEKNADLLKSTNDICRNQQMTNVDSNKSIYVTSTISSAISNSSLKVPAEEEFAKANEMNLASLPKSKRQIVEFTPKVREVGTQIINIFIKHEPEYIPPKNLSPMLQEIDFMLRLDKRDADKIYDVLNWALADSFWRDKMFKSNPVKYLREKYLQLKNKMEEKPKANPNQIDRRLRDKQGNVVDSWKDELF